MKAAIAQINTAALRHNLAVVKRHAPQCKIIAVVKANAYGHGLLPVARTLVDAAAYAVARIEEGTDEQLVEMTRRYLPPEAVEPYLEMARREHGPSVAVHLRPQHWFSADMGGF